MKTLWFALALAMGGVQGFSQGFALAQPAGYRGPARIVDGDTIEIGSVRIRFHGIDAPESRQTCLDEKAARYACGRASTEHLRALIGGREVRCTDLGPAINNRRRGRCFAGKVDLQAAMAKAGHAIAFLRHGADYVSEERAARAARRGLWQGQFKQPAQVRRCRNQGQGTIATCS